MICITGLNLLGTSIAQRGRGPGDYMEPGEEQPNRRKSEEPQPIRILAVDDDSTYLKYLTFILTRSGFDVETALNGREAIERIRTGPGVDLLLIDLAMPELDGIETVREIQQESRLPGLYTILLTASDGVDLRLRALDGGLDDFITKQSQETEILAKIRSAARRLQLERQLKIENQQLHALALTDELTGIANRRALFQAGEAILKADRQLSVALFDLDRFKQINDTYGHLAGDKILSDVATAFKMNTRLGDLIGRYGGDEFVLLLPDTGAEEARMIAQRVAAKIRQLTWTMEGRRISISVTFGAATCPGNARTLPDLLACCDQALYRSKKKSRSDSASHIRPKV